MADKPEFQDARRKSLYGKPSGAIGKKWKIGHRKFCLTMKGAGNHRWAGGKTEFSRRVRNLPEYAKWRLEVFRRDFFTCVMCGEKRCAGKRIIIHADHINPLSLLLEQFNIKVIDDAIACLPLWDVANGRTLCKECHKKTPTWGVNAKNYLQIQAHADR